MKKKRFGVNIGTASILIVFVVVCLVSFAVLSLVSANADYKLTQKLAERETDYYNACNLAYRDLNTIDDMLHVYEDEVKAELEAREDLAQGTSDFLRTGTDSYYRKCLNIDGFDHDTKLIIRTYEVSDMQKLYVEIYINSYGNSEHYSIKQWKLVADDDIAYDEKLPLLQ